MKFAKRTDGLESSVIRDILALASKQDIISFAGGLPNSDFFPIDEMEKAASNILSDPESAKVALQYGESSGFEPLRKLIAETYIAKDLLDIDYKKIIITNGSQQALDIIAKIFIDTDSTVLVERPTYLAALQSFSFYTRRFQDCRLEQDGPCLKSLKGCSDADIFYTIPNFQNPSGITWSNSKRQAVAEWATQNNILLIEDDPYGELRFEGERCKSLKHYSKNVILLGSFSKILAPGLRLGWMIMPDTESYEKALLVKQAGDLHSSFFTQLIIYEFYRNFDSQAHIKRISEKYKEQRDIMVRAIKKYMPNLEFVVPQGGMFLWVRFNSRIDSKELLSYALARGVAFVPGVAFYINEKKSSDARINFSNVNADKIEDGIYRLSLALADYVKDRSI